MLPDRAVKPTYVRSCRPRLALARNPIELYMLSGRGFADAQSGANRSRISEVFARIAIQPLEEAGHTNI